MTGPLRYPGADCTTQWVGKGSVLMPMNHVKWLQHTTETAGGWPSYSYGGISMGSAPTLTYEPWQHKWRQHFEINQSARALRNDGSYPTNRVDVVQTEISCYCDHALSAKYGHGVRSLDAQAIDDLGQFGEWLVKEWGMKSDSFYPATLPWPAYPAGCRRLTDSEFSVFSGVIGHMAAPGNTHLDPGDLDNVGIKAAMKGTPPPWPEFRTTSPAVGAMVKKLEANGYFIDGHRDRTNYYGAWTRGAIRRLQEDFDDTKADPDGLIGPLTWAHIEALPDAPPPPPPPKEKPLADAWQRATGDAVHAGEAFIAAHPNMPAYAALLRQQQAEWQAIHALNT